MQRPDLQILCSLLCLTAAGCEARSAPITAPGSPQAPKPQASSQPLAPRSAAPNAVDPAAQSAAELAELTQLFDSFGYAGCFALRSPNRADRLVHAETCRAGFLPASTFKIPNSLFALELGVARGPEHLYKWDGVDRGIAAWNQDHTLLTALQVSAVWYYQRIAREIGQARMQTAVDSIHYGNQKISPVLDEFWLVGDMRVTPLQQLDLLERLYRESLPFSKQAQRTVKRMLRSIDYPDLPIYAKTGRTRQPSVGDVGWYVGYVDAATGPHFFATLLTRTQPASGDDTFNEDRKRVSLELLRKTGSLSAAQR